MRFVSIAVLLIVFSVAHAIDAETAFSDPILQARYQKLTQELRCLVCQNATIADSGVPLAADLRRELRGLLASGKTDEEALKFLTDRYGDFVLYNPPLAPRTIVLWSAPIIALIVGFIVAVLVVRRRAQMPLEDDESGASSP